MKEKERRGDKNGRGIGSWKKKGQGKSSGKNILS